VSRVWRERPVSVCHHPACNRPTRMAVRTTRPHRDTLKSTIFYDDRTAPQTSDGYCRMHGAELITHLITTLVAADEEGEPDA
jgi:hypothetical protein